MGNSSFGIILENAKKIAKIENKVKYLESILDGVKVNASKEDLQGLINYKNNPVYTDADNFADEKTNLFFKSIIESMPFPVFIKDEQGIYQVVNALEANLFGVPEEEIIGKNDEYFIKNEEELALIRESDEKVLKSKTAIELPEQHFSLPNGSSYSFKTYKIPFLNPITGKTNIFGFSMDVTDSLKLNHLKKIVLLCSSPV